jgi:hypothetical protein
MGKAILAELLHETIARDRFPQSPRMRSFKAISTRCGALHDSLDKMTIHLDVPAAAIAGSRR